MYTSQRVMNNIGLPWVYQRSLPSRIVESRVWFIIIGEPGS